MKTMHFLARGIIQSQGHVLFAKTTGSDYWFLPGGHIEFGESARTAVLREIQEELGLKGLATSFVGAIEHSWPESKKDNHEINLLFNVEIANCISEQAPVSNEAHLRFEWLKVANLNEFSIEPKPIKDFLQSMNIEQHAMWGSTIES